MDCKVVLNVNGSIAFENSSGKFTNAAKNILEYTMNLLFGGMSIETFIVLTITNIKSKATVYLKVSKSIGSIFFALTMILTKIWLMQFMSTDMVANMTAFFLFVFISGSPS